MSPLLRRAGAVLALALTAGCAGYRLGPTSGVAAGSRSIEVFPFQNRTEEPRLTAPLTTALRSQLQQDGTYRLVSDGGGDVEVTGEIVRYERSELAFDPRDVLTPTEYRVEMVAHVVARERGTGRTLLDREVRGHTVLQVGLDLSSIERQASPVLAANLARNITSLLVDGDW